jgi:uncharacterized protein (TIGR00369 family)
MEEVRGGYPEPSLLALSGRERLTWLTRGRAPAPPLSRLTGAIYTRVGDGTASAEMPASGWLLNSAGVVGGGTLAILADVALGCSIETQLPPATPYTTAELSLSFLRPVHPGPVLSAEGQTIHVGRSVALSEAFLIEEKTEMLIAHGTSRGAILPPVDPAPEPPSELPAVEPDPDVDSDPYRRPWPTDAVIPQETWDRHSGREVLELQLSGELPSPPIHDLTGMRPVGIGDGTAAVVLPATRWLTSPLRTIQGGVIAMLADLAMTVAVHTTVPAGTAAAGLDLKVNYLRPALPDGRDLRARGAVVHAGRTLVVTRAEIDNADGKGVALATGSSMYLPNWPAALGELELAVATQDVVPARQAELPAACGRGSHDVS